MSIGYQLVKVDKSLSEESYYNYIFHPLRTGKYLCQLETFGGSKTHVVCIDCDLKEILDCHEGNVLRLSKRNLDYCCGQYLLGVREIAYCYKVEPTKRKNK